MNYLFNDDEYNKIIKPIIDNEEFIKINNCRHHGITRLEHSLRVSYYSYKISKKLKLNYKQVAEAGLLHDFFINDQLTYRQQRLSAFTHPRKCLENACKYFNLTSLQKDIIFSHMFPLIPNRIPKYMESWVVSFVDKFVATYEFVKSYYKLYFFKAEKYALLFMFVFTKF